MTAPTYAVHVHHGMLTYPAPGVFASAWDQLGPAMADHTGTEYHGVRGIDGREYVAEGVAPGAWRVVRFGSYSTAAVVRSDTVKSAVQRLNTFHVGETCVQCGHVNSTRGHACDACRQTRY